MNLYDDLIRLSKFMFHVRSTGIELLKDTLLRMKYTANPNLAQQQADGASSGDEKQSPQLQRSAPKKNSPKRKSPPEPTPNPQVQQQKKNSPQAPPPKKQKTSGAQQADQSANQLPPAPEQTVFAEEAAAVKSQ